MSDDESVNPMDVFVEQSKDDNLEIQIESIKRLPTLGVSLGEERVRKELMPYLEGFVETNYIHDEVLLNISEQLESFLPFVGGHGHASTILGVLEKLCAVDETIVRERAVESMQTIANTLHENQLESDFLPLIQKLGRQDWFTTKCSATGLFAVCYPKVCEERRVDLRTWFRNLIQDDSPMVRRSACTKFVDFAKVLEVDHIISEFVPILDNLVKDAQDSVRILAVGVAISIASKLQTPIEIHELVWKYFKALGDDASWRVRCQVASDIHEIQKSVGADIGRNDLLALYQNLVRDPENQVREAAAKNVANFCANLMESYSTVENANFEVIFQTDVMPLVKELYIDPNDEVRIALSSVLMALSTVLGINSVKNDLLPVIKASIEHDDSSKVKENIIKNLDSLIDVVGFNDIINSVHLLIEDLVCKSESQWRTRRSILVTFAHIAKHSDKQYFNEHLKDIYFRLLNDPVFAVRKTAPLIFPILVKSFGTTWALKSLLPQVFEYLNHVNYLYRFTTLFGIDEFVQPTLLDTSPESVTSKYLGGLEKLCQDIDATVQQNATYVLVKLIKLQQILKCEFEKAWIQEGFEGFDRTEFFNDDIKTYAEDTLENFSKDCDFDVFDVTKKELTAEEQEGSYLEGVLMFCIKHFLGAVQKLLQDPVENVQSRAKRTLLKIERFNDDFEKELAQNWVQEVLKKISVEDVAKIEEKLKEELLQNVIPEQTKKRDYVRDVIFEEPEPEDIELSLELEQDINANTEELNNNEKSVDDLEDNAKYEVHNKNQDNTKSQDQTKTQDEEIDNIVQLLDEKIATNL